MQERKESRIPIGQTGQFPSLPMGEQTTSEEQFELVSYDEYAIIPLQPVLDEPFKSEGETLLSTVYYGESMSPNLMPGDRVLLRKRENLPYFDSEVYLIQWGDPNNINNTFCRPKKSAKDGYVYMYFDNHSYLAEHEGYDIPEKHIIAYWELIASQRMHSFSYSTFRIPIIKKTNFNNNQKQ
jgi:hypothetical protein